jgi:RimJ/RimL family protein N-acetyltransferase
VRFETERLILREWTDADRDAYSGFVADPDVRRFYPTLLTRQQADETIDQFIASLARDGYSLLAIERKADGALIGRAGITPVDMPIRGNPPVEIGWLLGKQYWGNGYAPEAARAWIAHAFGSLGLNEIASWTAIVNAPSQRVMQKIGMVRDTLGDFDHPRVPEGSPLRPHVLYRLANPRSR